jgi:hypothetical protein
MVVYDGFWPDYLSYKDIACCGNTKSRPSDCPRPVGTELPISAAVNIISEQLSLPEADLNKKPVAVYGGPSTGKSTVISVLCEELKTIEDYQPMIVSLEKFAGDDETTFSGTRLSACALLAEAVAQQLVTESCGNVTEQERDWTNIIAHIEGCLRQQSKKFILLLDDLHFLEYPLKPDTEQLLTSLLRRQNWCLVFASCMPGFSIDNIPCVPTVRMGHPTSCEDLPEDVYHCAGVPALFLGKQLTSDCWTEHRIPPWKQLNFPRSKFHMNAKWPPILQFVDELFVPIPVPKTLQFCTHLSACVAGGSVLYWPLVAVAEILIEYAGDFGVDENTRYAAEAVHHTLYARSWNTRPHTGLCGFARVWENTVRISMLLWVIRMNEEPSTIRDFVSRMRGSWLDPLDVTQYKRVQLEDSVQMSSGGLHGYLAGVASSAPAESVTICLFANSCGDRPGYEIIREYSGMVCLKDREGIIDIFGFLTDRSRVRCQQPEWITGSVLILPHSQRCDLYREDELRCGRWAIWTEDEIGQHLGFSLQMTDLESGPVGNNKTRELTDPSEVVAEDKISLPRSSFFGHCSELRDGLLNSYSCGIGG